MTDSTQGIHTLRNCRRIFALIAEETCALCRSGHNCEHRLAADTVKILSDEVIQEDEALRSVVDRSEALEELRELMVEALGTGFKHDHYGVLPHDIKAVRDACWTCKVTQVLKKLEPREVIP